MTEKHDTTQQNNSNEPKRHWSEGSGLWDVSEGLKKPDLWVRLALSEIAKRYRRTTFGPFWTTLTVAFFVTAVGFMYSDAFGAEISTYMPFLASGLVIWAPMIGFIGEAGTLFLNAEAIIKQTRFSYTALACAAVLRNGIVFFHHLLVYVIVAFIFEVPLKFEMLMFVPGLLALAINGVWVALLIGMVCTRFRDVQQVITSILQVAFFVTPIFWAPDLVSGGTRAWVVHLNPLYHFIEILRAPLLGNLASIENWAVVTGFTIIGWIVTLLLFVRLRKRIIFWV